MMANDEPMSDARLAEIKRWFSGESYSIGTDMAQELLAEVERLRALASSLADADVYHADADGFEFCGICGSYADLDGLIHHDDDCGYYLALQWRQQNSEANQ